MNVSIEWEMPMPRSWFSEIWIIPAYHYVNVDLQLLQLPMCRFTSGNRKNFLNRPLFNRFQCGRME